MPNQQTALQQRMDLLESFLEKKSKSESSLSPRFASGQLTIIDLSDPFIDPASACGYFEIVTRLFVRANVHTGKVLVVDEAHKVRLRYIILFCMVDIHRNTVPWHQQGRMWTYEGTIVTCTPASPPRYEGDHQYSRYATCRVL